MLLALGRLALRTPAPGDEDRDVLRVAVTEDVVAVATAGGVYWSRDGVRFARVEAAFGEWRQRDSRSKRAPALRRSSGSRRNAD